MKGIFISDKYAYIRIMSAEPIPSGDQSLLTDLVRMRMPYGKYKDRILCDLPVSYLEWFARKGFPAGKLGTLLQTLYEIKLNGLEYLLQPLKQKYS
ncbi:DUF3820 family protein [Rurimicrobium arvi]|uniref:DUF3820 family protein n=1 Tax=Rurimicrobium arvi TaxID=2049916 RepID=A0ABP8MPL9_9BACT